MTTTPPPQPARRPRRSQAQRHAETHSALIAAGRRLFGEHGVGAVSAEQIVAAAGVTRGALYHHFKDKNDLFRAVFEQIEQELCAELVAVIDGAASTIEGLVASLGRYLDACQRPEVRRIALVEAPAVLGWAQWRAIEADYALGILTDRLRAAGEEGARLVGAPDVLAPLLLSTCIEAAMTMADADDADATRARVEPVLFAIAAGAVGITV